MKVHQLRDFPEFVKYEAKTRALYDAHLANISQKIPARETAFAVRGYSYPAGQMVDFAADFRWGPGYPAVNWREQLGCPLTGLNARLRASVHLLDLHLNPYDDSEIYIMEQTTALYRYLRSRYSNLVGSEFLGDGVKRGSVSAAGIRNEDATELTFGDSSVDIIISLEVFEHIPNYKKAFAEASRILRKGGRMLISVPFNVNSSKNIIRAAVRADGEIEHILPAEYHGDPLNAGGVLCFQHFGWEMIGELLEAGFKDAFGLFFWSEEMGYYGRHLQFVAEK